MSDKPVGLPAKNFIKQFFNDPKLLLQLVGIMLGAISAWYAFQNHEIQVRNSIPEVLVKSISVFQNIAKGI